ncbi:MAG: hypothetical protein ABI868_09645 [Acidobacteriota bacterium]
MHFARTDLVLPLGDAENAFLEVLLSRFTLQRKRRGEGVELRVSFDETTPAAWNRRGRETVRTRMPHFDTRAAFYRTRLDRILLDGGTGRFSHDDPDFPFRWASAGALPVLNIGQRDYYCLFFRDVFPIGWNIANGATGGSDELLNPLLALDRELGEELIIVDPQQQRRYTLRPDRDTLLDHPELATFRQRWREQYPNLDLTRFRAASLPLRWEAAPDRVTVRMGTRIARLEDCYVNINAADFGIELDRIARITVNERLVLCDGELNAQRALNRPVGLFDVSRLQQALLAGRTSFVPDRFYSGGTVRPGDAIAGFLNRTLRRDMKRWRSAPDISRFDSTPDDQKLNLCPVTAGIIRRHIASARSIRARAADRQEVFTQLSRSRRRT